MTAVDAPTTEVPTTLESLTLSATAAVKVRALLESGRSR